MVYAPGISTSPPPFDLDITYTFSKAQEKSRGTAESRGRSKVSLWFSSIDSEVSQLSSDPHNTDPHNTGPS